MSTSKMFTLRLSTDTVFGIISNIELGIIFKSRHKMLYLIWYLNFILKQRIVCFLMFLWYHIVDIFGGICTIHSYVCQENLQLSNK